MRKYLIGILAGTISMDLSIHGVAAMDNLWSMIPDYELSDEEGTLTNQISEEVANKLTQAREIDEKFQNGFMAENNIKIYGILDFAKFYNNYNVFCKQGSSFCPIPPNEFVEKYSNYLEKIENPELFRQMRALCSSMKPLPIGNYVKSNYCSPWMESKVETYTGRGQGFKLHVSAKPETALQIAHIVLPLLQENRIHHKVMYDLRYMRYTYYLSQYTNNMVKMPDGRSSQAGKFIAIYPNTQQEATTIVQRIHKAFKALNLCPEHFVQLPGDAQVGDTGGIFVRYGKFGEVQYKEVPPSNVAFVNERDEDIPQELIKKVYGYELPMGMRDSRLYPWPDYMNIRALYNGPFLGDLDITWVNPHDPTQVITWNDRPKCWVELQNQQSPQPHVN